MTDARHLDTALPIADRVEHLLSAMTLEEKAGQLEPVLLLRRLRRGARRSRHRRAAARAAGVHPRSRRWSRPRSRTVAAGSALFVKDAATANRLQRLAVESTRLGIPLIFGFDVIHGLRTIFPVPIALAASWDPAAIEAGQAVAAREARAAGIHWTFAPMVDIARDPRWGRIIEGAGEDPYLGAAVAAAQVRGFQGDHGPESVLAGPKHFAGYGAARGGRDYDEVEISDSELRNVYFPPFQAPIEAGAANVMSAYMDLNGVPASGNRWLLTDVLRDELGFDGFVVSDANAVKNLETQHFAAIGDGRRGPRGHAPASTWRCACSTRPTARFRMPSPRVASSEGGDRHRRAPRARPRSSASACSRTRTRMRPPPDAVLDGARAPRARERHRRERTAVLLKNDGAPAARRLGTSARSP